MSRRQVSVQDISGAIQFASTYSNKLREHRDCTGILCNRRESQPRSAGNYGCRFSLTPVIDCCVLDAMVKHGETNQWKKIAIQQLERARACRCGIFRLLHIILNMAQEIQARRTREVGFKGRPICILGMCYLDPINFQILGKTGAPLYCVLLSSFFGQHGSLSFRFFTLKLLMVEWFLQHKFGFLFTMNLTRSDQRMPWRPIKGIVGHLP